jgi:hypothetical protein
MVGKTEQENKKEPGSTLNLKCDSLNQFAAGIRSGKIKRKNYVSRKKFLFFSGE